MPVKNAELYEHLAGAKTLPDQGELAHQAATDPELRAALVESLHESNDVVRSNAFAILFELAQNRPAALADSWDPLAALLESANAFHRAIGIRLLSRLGQDPRFDALLPRYMGMLDDSKVMVSRYLAQAAPEVVQRRPDLTGRITDYLLAVDDTQHNSDRRDLIKADIIGYLESVWETSEDRKRLLDFVRPSLECSSPKARKAARQFLKAHEP